MSTKEREQIKRTAMQKMARLYKKEGGNHLEQDSNRQNAMEDIDGGLHPAVDGQSVGEGVKYTNVSLWLTKFTASWCLKVKISIPSELFKSFSYDTSLWLHFSSLLLYIEVKWQDIATKSEATL